MKQDLTLGGLALLAAGAFSLFSLIGCGDGSPKLAMRYRLTGGTNTVMYVEYHRVGAVDMDIMTEGNGSDGSDTTSSRRCRPGQYQFRVWFPAVVAHPAQPLVPAPQGQAHAELLVNDKVAATIDLDAAHPHFEKDVCSRTVELAVE